MQSHTGHDLGGQTVKDLKPFLLQKEGPNFAGSLCRKTAKEKAECFTHQHNVFFDRK